MEAALALNLAVTGHPSRDDDDTVASSTSNAVSG